jgi:F420-non-reducing hydrogenase iron-sulfur subunit
VAKAMLEGADGVLIGGCHPGDCHYRSGNYKARRRAAILHRVLEQLGLDPRRVWLRWISASEGQYFADTVTEMVEAITEMGPSPLRKHWSI